MFSQNEYSMSFDGLDDYIFIDGISIPNDSFTIAFWLKPNDTGNFIFSVGQSPPN